MPRLTGRGSALLALAVLAYLGAHLLGTWELYLLSLAFLALLVLSWLAVLFSGRRIWVTRDLSPERPVAGDEPKVLSIVRNPSVLPGPQLALRHQLASLADGDLEQHVGSVPPRGRSILGAGVGRVSRGVHHLPAARALAEDPLGVARGVRKASDPLVVTVLPRIASLDSCALQPRMALRQDWSTRRGLHTFGGTEFRGVRPHQPGEPLSHVDWKSTAKAGTLMLRETEEPAGADVTILLDGTANAVTGKAPDTNFELAVSAAGSIADFALRAGRRVNLICHERTQRQESLTADGAGRRALLQSLAEARPDALSPFSAVLGQLWVGGAHLLRVESLTIVSISLDPQLARQLVELREAGVKVAFLYVVAASFAEPQSGSVSYLKPFLPPRHDEPSMALPSLPVLSPQLGEATQLSHDPLPVELRPLLLSMSAAAIPSQTIARGDDLVRRLSLWRPARQSGAIAH